MKKRPEPKGSPNIFQPTLGRGSVFFPVDASGSPRGEPVDVATSFQLVDKKNPSVSETRLALVQSRVDQLETGRHVGWHPPRTEGVTGYFPAHARPGVDFLSRRCFGTPRGQPVDVATSFQLVDNKNPSVSETRLALVQSLVDQLETGRHVGWHHGWRLSNRLSTSWKLVAT